MSLDVYLKLEPTSNGPQQFSSGIFIREDGQRKEITRDEWNERFPDREPLVAMARDDTEEVYHANITHNLNKMADEAGLYVFLWRPDELIGETRARDLIVPLREGLALLKSDPERFRQFDPSNGWGSYDGFVPWVEDYLKACEKYPNAKVSVWR